MLTIRLCWIDDLSTNQIIGHITKDFLLT